jgi:glycosyltransferase involved in cell wall biosynthesis
MRILIATDAWRPQVNGVVHTLEATAQAAEAFGARIAFLTPEGYPSVALPSYPGIRLALPNARDIARRIADTKPDVIHVATEGPIGHLVRRHCLANRRPFTTSLHTRFADYVAARWPVPRQWIWGWLRWFHNAGGGTMVATASLAGELRGRGFRSLLLWPRGVDARLFHPGGGRDLGVPRPVFLAVGRLAVEKNVEAFCPSTCRAARSWSATGRSGRCWRAGSRTRGFSARGGAPISRRFTPAPMHSCFQAAPIRMASCCWKRWRAGCRSPVIRSQRPAT